MKPSGSSFFGEMATILQYRVLPLISAVMSPHLNMTVSDEIESLHQTRVTHVMHA